jgi:lipoprotein-anchoring transpeptidase ErfK/SrfK
VTTGTRGAYINRRWRLLAALAAAVTLLAACSSGEPGSGRTVTVTRSATPPPPASTSPSSTAASASPTPTPARTQTKTKTKPTGPPVHIKLFNVDGSTYGVGMPVILFFSQPITSAKALQDATQLTVNGRPAEGAWYFETSGYLRGYPYEAHFRMKDYWPAHSHIQVNIPVKGLSAGKYVYDDSLSLSFATGAKHVGVVDNRTHRLTITSDGKPWGTFPVSLGARKTPTLNGTKVIMEKGLDISMRGPGYYDPHVKYTQRLTYGGEYLHAAPWNCTRGWHCEGPQNNIGHANSSNGCTNLRPADAKKLYNFLRIGDVVQFPNADGPRMQLGQGYGDWNVQWSAWQTGGLVSTR